jgi:lysophospholipase L1-like esterase
VKTCHCLPAYQRENQNMKCYLTRLLLVVVGVVAAAAGKVKQHNEKSIPKARLTKVACIGDSITDGGGCLEESYVDLLQQQLGPEGYDLLNAGISSVTMLKQGLCNDLSPCSYWDTEAWQEALDSQADVYTIMLGTNDAKYFNWEGVQQNTGDYYALDYVSMVRQIRKNTPLAAVFVMIPPPLYDPYPYDMNSTVINDIFSSLIRDIAENMDVTVVDVFAAFNSANASVSTELSCDGCHPTHEGNVIIANAISEAITATAV